MKKLSWNGSVDFHSLGFNRAPQDSMLSKTECAREFVSLFAYQFKLIVSVNHNVFQHTKSYELLNAFGFYNRQHCIWIYGNIIIKQKNVTVSHVHIITMNKGSDKNVSDKVYNVCVV